MTDTDPAGHPVDLSELRFVTRVVRPEDAATVAAVLGSLLAEESELASQEPSTAQSAWDRSTRVLRGPITPGNGRWRAFSG